MCAIPRAPSRANVGIKPGVRRGESLLVCPTPTAATRLRNRSRRVRIAMTSSLAYASSSRRACGQTAHHRGRARSASCGPKLLADDFSRIAHRALVPSPKRQEAWPVLKGLRRSTRREVVNIVSSRYYLACDNLRSLPRNHGASGSARPGGRR